MKLRSCHFSIFMLYITKNYLKRRLKMGRKVPQPSPNKSTGGDQKGITTKPDTIITKPAPPPPPPPPPKR